MEEGWRGGGLVPGGWRGRCLRRCCPGQYAAISIGRGKGGEKSMVFAHLFIQPIFIDCLLDSVHGVMYCKRWGRNREWPQRFARDSPHLPETGDLLRPLRIQERSSKADYSWKTGGDRSLTKTQKLLISYLSTSTSTYVGTWVFTRARVPPLGHERNQSPHLYAGSGTRQHRLWVTGNREG